MKIVNLDGYTTNPGDLSWDWLAQYGTYTIYDRTAPDQVMERAREAEVLIVNKTLLPRSVLEQLPKLRYVGLQSTGYNVIDCAAARELGVTVTNIPSYSTSAVAQLVFALILEHTNQTALHSRSVYDGEWSRCADFCYWKTPLQELQGKTIGIVGFGKIGRAVARIAAAFDMNILAYATTPKEPDGLPVRMCSMEELLEQSDFVTLHCPLTSDTEGLIGREALERMKPTAILINTSRGPVVDEQALADALNSGGIAGAGLDVLSQEPCSPDNPLLQAKNCFITPHIAWAGFETRRRLLGILEENLKAWIAGNPINVVNL
ncbi:MAG: D-2-hydroxyacid dehydrogenase [Clostridiales bacterium]|nr:D-2-hydroxyacid dehydrogenase [Clostridiales bacterium]